MSWKVYNIHTGKIIKAGFDDEEAAKDWLELRRDLATEDFLVEELDEEEEEALEEEEEVVDAFVPDAVDEDEEVEDLERHGMSYDDEEDLEEDDDEDEDEEEDEDDEEDEDF